MFRARGQTHGTGTHPRRRAASTRLRERDARRADLRLCAVQFVSRRRRRGVQIPQRPRARLALAPVDGRGIMWGAATVRVSRDRGGRGRTPRVPPLLPFESKSWAQPFEYLVGGNVRRLPGRLPARGAGARGRDEPGRASIARVQKRELLLPSGKKGHGLPGSGTRSDRRKAKIKVAGDERPKPKPSTTAATKIAPVRHELNLVFL